MPSAAEALDSLRTVVRTKREILKEKLANGHKQEDLPGQCIAYREVIEAITSQIKSINGGKED